MVPGTQAKERLHRVNIEIKASNIHRYGVFADEVILPGEMIEECPVIVFDNMPKEVSNYAFAWKDGKVAVPFGCGCVYNHDAQPNAKFERDYVNQMLSFVAIKPIHRNEEILINYGKNWFQQREFNSQNSQVTEVVKNKSTTGRVVFLSFLLLFGYGVTSIVASNHAHFAPAVTSVLQQQNLAH